MRKIISIALSLTIICGMFTLLNISGSALTSLSLLGDADGNDAIEIKDATQIQKHLVGLVTLTDEEWNLADVNYDADVNVKDATEIQKYLVGLSTISGIGKTTITAPSSDTLVTSINYTDTSVTLTNAAGEIVSSEKATNVKITNNTFVDVIAPGDLTVSGECSNGQLKVSISKEDYVGTASAIEITLSGLSLTCTTDSPIYVAEIDDWCSLSLKKGTTSTVTDGTSYTNADQDAGAIYSMDDLKIKGKGSLVVNGNCAYGICSKDDLKLWNGNITVNAVDTGVKGKDSVRIGDPDDFGVSGAYDNLSLNITTQTGDGIRSNNDTDLGKGYITIEGGTININSYKDGIQAAQAMTIDGGTFNITTYKGSSYSVPTNSTAKAIKCEGDMIINDGTFTVNSSDDAFHCGNDLTFNGGTYTIGTGDDGIHSDNKLTINDGTLNITKSYEGIEGIYIYINGGKIDVVSSDDGVNAAGGKDGSSPTFGPMQSSSTGAMYITGGVMTVNANGDGLDANGSITMSGGTVVVSGQASSGNGALDYDSSFTMTGGTIIACGYSGMAQQVSSATGVCSAMINTSTTVQANTMLAINDSSDNNLITVKVPKACNSIVFASSKLTQGSSYTLYSGGSYSGNNQNNMYYYDGTYTKGTSISTWTQSTAIYGGSSGGGGRPR